MKTRIENSGLKDFTIQCLTNRLIDGGQTADRIRAHWEAAEDIDAFKEAVLNDAQLKHTQAFAVLSRETPGHWYRVREMFGRKCLHTVSDAGAVKIGNGLFSTLVSNGIGDGTTRIAVFAKGEGFNENMMNYSGVSAHGEFSIYDCDCGGVPIVELNGNYTVYNYEGMVAFVEF